MSRLSSSTAPDVPRPVSRGIVHLGLGAFHRAHQAAFTHEAALLTGDSSWGITGVTQRSATVAEQLRPQDGLFTLVEKGPGIDRASVVGSITEVISAVDDADAVVDAIADPRVRIVSLTVTEKGYRLDPATGRLRVDDPEIVADLTGRSPGTVVGQLVAGLALRVKLDAPVTVLSCDNLPHNGVLLAGIVRDYVAQRDDATALQSWIDSAASFPNSMVDRIVPATTDEDRRRLEDETGLRDDAVVVCEPFRQWVIEDHFAAERPAWDLVGVQFVTDVEPWETMKLRVLNASHSLLAYLGVRSGHSTIADAVADPVLKSLAHRMIVSDVAPTLHPDMNSDAYANEVLTRFANPTLPHTTRQVAMDGSQKLGPRLLGTVRDAQGRGSSTTWLAVAVASWVAYVIDEVRAGRALDDPMADVLSRAATQDDAVAALLSVEQIFGADLGPDSPFGRRVAAAADLLVGSAAVTTEFVANIERELS
ncbi:mannitol dehydrogenase [Rhodococcus sp. 06-418-1B]|nr:mannitol dehydrogenase family protein [Rhodococcus sp. 06-418-1B]OZC86153.1 mannitol dehydrogenase [Rhodococcus sp. 06-418-1B]